MILAGITMALFVAWRLVGTIMSDGSISVLDLFGSPAERFNLIALASLVIPIVVLLPIELWMGIRLWARGDWYRSRSLMLRMLIASSVLWILAVAIAFSPLLNRVGAVWVFVSLSLFVYIGGAYYAGHHADLRAGRSWLGFASRFVGLDLAFLGLLVAYIATGVRHAAVMLCR
jgi:hypothetical protein